MTGTFSCRRFSRYLKTHHDDINVFSLIPLGFGNSAISIVRPSILPSTADSIHVFPIACQESLAKNAGWRARIANFPVPISRGRAAMGPGSLLKCRHAGTTGTLQPLFANPKARAAKPPGTRAHGA